MKMRRIISILMTLVLCVSVFAVPVSAKEQPIKVKLCNYVNPEGKWVDSKYIKFDVDPIIIDGRTMVPIRAIAEELGWKVRWDSYGEIGGKVHLFKNVPSDFDFDTNPQLLAYVYNMRKHIDGKSLSTEGDEVYLMNNKSGEGIRDEYNLDKILYSGKQIYFNVNIHVSKDKPYGPYGNGNNGTVANDFYANIFNIMEDNSYFMGSYGTSGDVHPQIIDDRTLIPLRQLSEIMGLTVSWDDTTRTVTITA